MSVPSIATFMGRLPAAGGLALIRLYQLILSPLKVGLFGPGAACRFYPTCSDYGLEAIRQHGLLMGTFRTICRILRCHPFHPGGYDPVPPRRSGPTQTKQPGCSHRCSH